MNKISPIEAWPDNAADAIGLQKQMAGKVVLQDRFERMETVAGVDCSYDTQSNLSFSVVTIMRLDDLKPLKTVRATLPTEFPYIPGLLSFREIPVILEALKKLDALPDLLMVDGQGISHPRRLGIAAHLGAMLNWPAIGVAKSLLCGSYKEPAQNKGAQSDLFHKGEKIGTVLRSKEKCKPLFISPGHRISHASAVDLTLRCLTKYRLPEPTRIADKISKDKPGKNEDALL